MFLLGILFGAVLTICILVSVDVKPQAFENISMSYADTAAIVLAAVGVLVTVLGVFIAILAIWGYSQFRSMATSAASSHIEKEVQDGPLRVEIEKIVLAYISQELSEGKLRRMIEQRVDMVVYSGAEKRAKEEDATIFGDEQEDHEE